VCASGQSLVQRSATVCDVCECGREASIMKRLGSIGAVALGGGSCKDRTVVIKQTHTLDLEQRCGRQITVQDKLLQKSVIEAGVSMRNAFSVASTSVYQTVICTTILPRE